MAQMVKNLPTMWETRVPSQDWEDPLEKGMATHSSVLAWRIPWTEKPGRLQSAIFVEGIITVEFWQWIFYLTHFFLLLLIRITLKGREVSSSICGYIQLFMYMNMSSYSYEYELMALSLKLFLLTKYSYFVSQVFQKSAPLTF